VTSSLATSTARSTTVSWGRASCQLWQTSRTTARAAAGRGRDRGQPQLIAQLGRVGQGRVQASSTVAYSHSRCGGWTWCKTSATCGCAPQRSTLVVGQRPTLAGDGLVDPRDLVLDSGNLLGRVRRQLPEGPALGPRLLGPRNQLGPAGLRIGRHVGVHTSDTALLPTWHV